MHGHLKKVIEDDALPVRAIGDGLDQGAQIARHLAAELGAVPVEPRGQRHGFANEMGQTALSARMVAIGPVAIAHQPAEKSLADHRDQVALAPAPDAEDHNGP